MRTHTMAIFLAAWLLFWAAQAGIVPAAQDYEEPDYQFEELTAGEAFPDGGGTASYSCRVMLLSVANPERLSPEDGSAAERNMENFNGRMRSLLEVYTGRAAQLMEELSDSRGGPYYDETSASCTVTGQIVSVRLDNGSYTGGAHPNRYTEGLLFDLGAGQFTDPVQLADDPASFLSGTAELLLEKAEAHPAHEFFWQDYTDLVARWNEGTVLFDSEGMEVIYSPYEIAPYSVSEVELRLDWEELAQLLGPGGMARLGVETEITEDLSPVGERGPFYMYDQKCRSLPVGRP